MKAISIIEPYASLIRDGVKHIETRSWKTNYRGAILIHSSGKNIPKEYRENIELMQYVKSWRPGCILASANLVDCIEMTEEFITGLSDQERATGFYEVGRYAWILENVLPVFPVQCKGHLGVWNYEPDTYYGLEDYRTVRCPHCGEVYNLNPDEVFSDGFTLCPFCQDPFEAEDNRY